MICAACGKSFDNDVEATRQSHEPCASKLAEAAPSASTNSAMLEIALLLKDLVVDTEWHGIVNADVYCKRLNAVIARLQQ